MKRRFLAILAILVGSVSIVTYAQCRQESYVCDEPEVTIVEPKKITDGECCVPFVEAIPYEEVVKVVDEVQSSPFSGEDEYLLVKIAMAEAEGECIEGKAMVIRVVLNREESSAFPDTIVILTVLNRVGSNEFPDTIYDVIYQPDQFSPVGSGRFDAVEPSDECYQALNMVIDGWDESQGALYFESCDNADNWHSRNLEHLFTHGRHRFYK